MLDFLKMYAQLHKWFVFFCVTFASFGVYFVYIEQAGDNNWIVVAVGMGALLFHFVGTLIDTFKGGTN